MQILIDVPDKVYESTLGTSAETIKPLDAIEILRAFKNGKRLPKRHGRLGDLGKIYVELNEAQTEGTSEYKGLGEAKQIVCNAKTIIEADKDGE